ncbi:hypothetical protein AAE478_008312 [Parahypoxylon ruwenzoriense]
MADNADIESQISQGNTSNETQTTTLCTDHGENIDLSASKFRQKDDNLLKKLKGIFYNKQKESEGSDTSNYLIRTIHGSPDGYPKLGAFMASNQNFLIFRRFGYLQARVLLNLQNQLRVLENELDDLEGRSRSSSILSAEGTDEDSRRRVALLQSVEDKLEKYETLLYYASYFALQAGPSDTDFNSLRLFHSQRREPIEKTEWHCLHKEDLIALKPRGDTASMDGVLMKFLLDKPSKIIQKVFKDPERGDRDDSIIVHSGRKFMILKAGVLGISLVALLVCPIYPLYHLSQSEMTSGTLIGIMFIQLGFTCVFACCLRFLTRPRRHELFAGSVAYMGLLIVFMSQTIQK